MNLRNRVLALMLVAFALTSLALSPVSADETKTVNVIKVGDGNGEPLVFRFENETGFSDIADGESQSITAENGEAVTVTRNGDQFSLVTSDGRTIDMPRIASAHTDSGEAHHVVHNQKKVMKFVHTDGEDSDHIIILTPGGLSDEQQSVIRQSIQAAGINKEVRFIGGEEGSEVSFQFEIEH